MLRQPYGGVYKVAPKKQIFQHRLYTRTMYANYTEYYYNCIHHRNLITGQVVQILDNESMEYLVFSISYLNETKLGRISIYKPKNKNITDSYTTRYIDFMKR